jgi:hypothetical protein
MKLIYFIFGFIIITILVYGQNKNEVIKPFETLIKFAKAHDIPLSGIYLAREPSNPHEGDKITLLITLFEGSESQQWLAIIKQDNLTIEERHLEPLPEDVIYTSTGRELHFKNTRTALDVYLIGPFTLDGSTEQDMLNYKLKTPYKTLVSREHLSLGLDRYALTAIELTKRSVSVGAKKEDLFYIGAPSPLSKNQLKQGQRYFKLIHPTEEEESIRFNVTLALNAFLSAAFDVDEFRDIIYKVLERPSIWSVISGFGVSRGLWYDPQNVHPVDTKYLGINLPALNSLFNLI